MQYILIFIGGGLGSLARYELSQKVERAAVSTFPFGTLAVNLLSCFILGLLFSLFALRGSTGNSSRLFLAIGFCGGFSTFSSFTLETFELMKTGQYFYAVGNIILSVLSCMFAYWLGWTVSKMLQV